MAESNIEQTLQALQAALATIVAGTVYDSVSGAAYNYTPNKVLRCPLSDQCADGSNEVVYVVTEDDVQIQNCTLSTEEALIPVDIAVLMKFAPGSENPYNPPSDLRQTIMSRLLQDAWGCLMAQNRKRRDHGLPILGIDGVVWIDKKLETRSYEKTYVANWAVAMLRIEIQCVYSDVAP